MLMVAVPPAVFGISYQRIVAGGTPTTLDQTVRAPRVFPPANDTLITYAENCGGTATISHSVDATAPGSCPNNFVVTRSYYATDACNNKSIAFVQTITVNDTTVPTIYEHTWFSGRQCSSVLRLCPPLMIPRS